MAVHPGRLTSFLPSNFDFPQFEKLNLEGFFLDRLRKEVYILHTLFNE